MVPSITPRRPLGPASVFLKEAGESSVVSLQGPAKAEDVEAGNDKTPDSKKYS